MAYRRVFNFQLPFLDSRGKQMITLRKSSSRGYAHHDWLENWHSFSFADYYDPANIRFGSLHVINEDIVQPGTGFDTHGHRDMEILTYVLSGALQHKDNMGNGTQMRYGEVQLMSAGTGVQHSEFNPSPDEPVHLLQIWIMPDRQGLTPGYQQKNFSVRKTGALVFAGFAGCGTRLVIDSSGCAGVCRQAGRHADIGLSAGYRVQGLSACSAWWPASQ